EVYKALSNDPSTGISMKQLIKIVADDVTEVDTSWKDFMPPGSYRSIEKEKLPHGFAEGDLAEVPLIETQVFLPWLQQQLETKGVSFTRKNISSFGQLDI